MTTPVRLLLACLLCGCDPQPSPPGPAQAPQGSRFMPEGPERVPAPEPRLGDVVLSELGADLPADTLIPAVLTRWLPGHGDIRTRLERGRSQQWFRRLDATLPAAQRPRLVEYVHRTFTAEARMFEKFFEIGRSKYTKGGGGDAAKHLSFVREDFGLAVISATKRLLRDLPDAEAGAVRAMTPGTARGWLSTEEFEADQGD